MSEPLITVASVSKDYALYASPADRLKELVLRRPYHTPFRALDGVSFTVAPGETLGIVGHNGSGKSTLLQILAGVMQPTTGRVQVHGRVAALLELGAGFNPEFTGRENVFLNGAIMGIPEVEMQNRFDAITAFADIGEFIDYPTKTYSSGMLVRLAFATAIHVDADVLIIDEALAVGDAYFQHRCMLRMAELQGQGLTIVVVSHDATTIKRLCGRVLWLEHGRIADDGDPEQVVGRYLASLFGHAERPVTAAMASALPADALLQPPNVDRRFGNADAEIVGVGLFDAAGRPQVSMVHGRPFELRARILFHRSVAHPIVGFVLRDWMGTDLTSTNTTIEGNSLPPAEAGDVFTVGFHCRPPLLHPGHYAFTVAVADGALSQYTMNDWIDNAILLEVVGELHIDTIMRFPVTCTLDRSTVLSPTGAPAARA